MNPRASDIFLQFRRLRSLDAQRITALTCGHVIAACMLSSCAVSANPPEESLAKFRPPTAQENFKRTLADRLQKIRNEPKLAGWATLLNGKSAEADGKLEAARELYSKVAAGSSAYPEALLRRALLSNVPEKTEEIGDAIHRARRNDLNADFLLLQARRAERSGSNLSALTLYQTLRKRFPASDAAEIARPASNALIAKLQVLPADQQVQEAELLTSEGDGDRAAVLVRSLVNAQKPGSEQFYDARLREESVLRKSGRKDAADAILRELTEKAPERVAAEALHQRIRIAWNGNQHAEALQLIGSFGSRFPGSVFRIPVLYISGRINEELNQPEQAMRIYQSYLKEDALDGSSRRQALYQVAWIKLRAGQYADAAGALLDLRNTIKAELTTNSGNSELTLLLAHTIYWLADSLEHAKRSELRPDVQNVTPAGLREELNQIAPYGYYAFRSGAYRTPKPNPACIPSTPAVDAELLTRLQQAGLQDIAQHEINWQFRQVSAGSAPTSELRRASLLGTYGAAKAAIGAAESYLKQAADIDDGPNCTQQALLVSHPTPYIADFRKASAEHAVAVPLLLAIARTESHFDPYAMSGKDARGLLQLLPSTAAAEGWNSKDDLFAAPVNINLGAKHFSRLTKRYNGEFVFAIAAYNAGIPAVERWRARYPNLPIDAWIEQIPYAETRNYVKKVLLDENFYRAIAAPAN